MEKFIGLSLFSSAGVAEMNLSPYIDFVLANELLPIRAQVHEYWYPRTEMVCGDITTDSVKTQIIDKSKYKKVDFILATPPCQGVSLIGKNKRNDQFIKDKRNYLIFHALDIIDEVKPNVVVIENVDRFAKMSFPYEESFSDIDCILRDKYKGIYDVHTNIYNAADYGVPQARKRLIIVMTKDGYTFELPEKHSKQITVKEAIGDLPSLESGQSSNLKHHWARTHTPEHILYMRHTPTGKSAFENELYYPQKKDGTRITGYPYTYKRIDWDKPSPTITMRSDTISATHTVHPGRLLENGLYSDARVLTLRELFILSSVNPDIDLPDFASASQIRYIIGEAVPPLLMEEICKNIKKKDEQESLKGLSLFCSAGIAETYFADNGIDIVVASELVPKRCDLHSWLYPKCNTICGDITDPKVFSMVRKATIENGCKFLLATPPCQGMSTLGKKDYIKDKRNYLIFYVFDMIDQCDFDYILIENVPKFLSMFFPYKDGLYSLLDIINEKYSKEFNVESFILNAKDYGVPQSRPRGFIKIWKKGLKWSNPVPEPEITLRQAIGDLPSLEAGEDSGIKWHYAKAHNERDIDAMKHTPEGKSAFLNPIHYPKKENGERMKGFHNTFARIKWDEPCPARAMQSGNMGGHNNVHPGRPNGDGTYSDARVLTLRELFIVSSLPPDWDLPEWCTDTFIRQIIGEAIPPRFSESIVKGVGK